jgi:hypothetical protein
MREVFGDARLTTTADGFALEAPGLHRPALLIASTAGVAVPDLSDHLGRVLSFVGALEGPGENLEVLRLHANELHLAPTASDDPAPSPVWAVLTGNLGRDGDSDKGAAYNPKKDRVTGSLAYAKGDAGTSWLRISCYAHYAAAALLAELEAGAAITAYGALESYDYNSKPRLQLALRGFQLTRAGGSGRPTPITLMSSRSRDDIAPQADAFTAAA